MITRIIKISIDKEKQESFTKFINPLHDKFMQIDGCTQFEVFREKEENRIYFIYTIWKNEAKLNKFRKSDFNKSFWNKLNELAESSPQVWTVENIFEK